MCISKRRPNSSSVGRFINFVKIQVFSNKNEVIEREPLFSRNEAATCDVTKQERTHRAASQGRSVAQVTSYFRKLFHSHNKDNTNIAMI